MKTGTQLDNLAARIVARTLRNVEPNERAAILARMVAHSAAGLRLIVGAEHAAEAVYAVADQLVSKETA